MMQSSQFLSFSFLKHALLDICLDVSKAVLPIYYDQSQQNIEIKDDQSPVTQADKKAHQIITHALQELTPDIPILSEESKQSETEGHRKWLCYWLIDPIDGTKEFINGTGDFAINIALVFGKSPIAGFVYAPFYQEGFFALQNHGSWKTLDQGKSWQRIQVSPTNSEQLALITSHHSNHSKIGQWITQQRQQGRYINHQCMGSALKICKVAEGTADVYPRFGPTSEWDTAAGHIILEEAGGVLNTLDNTPVQYNKPDSILNPKFYAGNTTFDFQEILRQV